MCNIYIALLKTWILQIQLLSPSDYPSSIAAYALLGSQIHNRVSPAPGIYRSNCPHIDISTPVELATVFFDTPDCGTGR